MTVLPLKLLNEAEDWKGLNKKTNPIKLKISSNANKRGKYFIAYLDIEIIHKRRKFTLMLLMNENFLKPVNIGKQIVSVRNTCAFDSIIQRILTAYHDFAPYSEYLEEYNIYLSEFIQTLSTMSATVKLYKERGYILSTTKEIKDGILIVRSIFHICKKNSSSVICRLLRKLFDALIVYSKTQKLCRFCILIQSSYINMA